jgi:hypothetical protein
MSGGFVAFHDGDQQDICDQVTRDGRVTVDALAFQMGEARFGGIVVQQVPDPA